MKVIYKSKGIVIIMSEPATGPKIHEPIETKMPDTSNMRTLEELKEFWDYKGE